MDIEWEDPPATAKINGRRPGRYAELAELLRQHPGKWAKIPTLDGRERAEGTAVGLAQSIRRGKIKSFEPENAFESAFEGTTVWACYKATSAEEATTEAADQPVQVRPEIGEGNGSNGNGSDLAPKVRQWAKRQGIGVAERGRLPSHVVEAYLLEFPEDREAATALES